MDQKEDEFLSLSNIDFGNGDFGMDSHINFFSFS